MLPGAAGHRPAQPLSLGACPPIAQVRRLPQGQDSRSQFQDCLVRARSDILSMRTGWAQGPAWPALGRGSPQTQEHEDRPLWSILSPPHAGRPWSRNASDTDQPPQAFLASAHCPSPVTPGSCPLHLAPRVPHPDQAHHLALVVHLFPELPSAPASSMHVNTP